MSPAPMSPGFTSRRRAASFHDLLERDPGSPPATARERAWLDLVDQLRATPAPPARPDFVAGLRERLMSAAPAALTPAGASPASATAATPLPEADRREDRLALRPRRSRRERRLVAALAAMAVVGAGSGAAYASQRALPGDTLYPLKRAIENVELSIETQPQQRAQSLLASADDRLAEVEALGRRGDLDADAVRTTLASFSDQATAGSDLVVAGLGDGGNEGEARALRRFTSQSMTVLDGFEPVVPAAARPALVDAARTLYQIDDTARRLCSCGGPVVPLSPALLGSTPLEGGVPGGLTGGSDPALPSQRGPGSGGSDGSGDPGGTGDAAQPGQDGSAGTGRGSGPAPGAGGTPSTGAGLPGGRSEPDARGGQGRQGVRAGRGAGGAPSAATSDLPGAAELVETLESLTDQLSDLPDAPGGTGGAGGAGPSVGPPQQETSRPRQGSGAGGRTGRDPRSGPRQDSGAPRGSGNAPGGLRDLGESVDDALDGLAADLLP